MDAPDTPAPLLHLKAMIWVQSVIGALLGVALFGCWLTSQEARWVWGILLCGAIWGFGYVPIAGKARALRPEHRVPATGWPPLFVLLVSFGEILSGPALFAHRGELIIPLNLVLGITILLRVVTSNALDVPYHRGTWGPILGAVGAMSLFQLCTLAMALAGAGC